MHPLKNDPFIPENPFLFWIAPYPLVSIYRGLRAPFVKENFNTHKTNSKELIQIRRDQFSDLICTIGRISLAAGVSQAWKLLLRRKIPFLAYGTFGRDLTSIGGITLQASLSLPSALLTIGYKTFMFGIEAAKDRTESSFNRFTLGTSAFTYPLMIAGYGFRYVMQITHHSKEDIGILEGKKGLFHRMADPIANKIIR